MHPSASVTSKNLSVTILGRETVYTATGEASSTLLYSVTNEKEEVILPGTIKAMKMETVTSSLAKQTFINNRTYEGENSKTKKPLQRAVRKLDVFFQCVAYPLLFPPLVL